MPKIPATLTQTALKSVHFRNLLPDWLSILRTQYPRSVPNAIAIKTPPPELYELGHFLTHPSLTWHYKTEPEDLLLLVLPWGHTPLYFGPLATEDNLGICHIAHSLLSDDNQRLLNIQPIGSTTHPIWITHITTPDATSPTLFAQNSHNTQKHRGASTTDTALKLPTFCTQYLTSSSPPHPLQGKTALQQSTSNHATDLWQQEPSLNIGNWHAVVQLSLQITPLQTTRYHAKLTYRHPAHGSMLPLENTIDIKGPYSEKENQYHFSTLLNQLQSHFNELFEIRNNALLLLQQLHPKIRTTWHTHGYILTVVNSISPTYPSLQLKLSLKKHKANSTASPSSTHIYLSIHSKQQSLPQQYQDSHQFHPVSDASALILQSIQQVGTAYHWSTINQLTC